MDRKVFLSVLVLSTAFAGFLYLDGLSPQAQGNQEDGVQEFNLEKINNSFFLYEVEDAPYLNYQSVIQNITWNSDKKRWEGTGPSNFAVINGTKAIPVRSDGNGGEFAIRYGDELIRNALLPFEYDDRLYYFENLGTTEDLLLSLKDSELKFEGIGNVYTEGEMSYIGANATENTTYAYHVRNGEIIGEYKGNVTAPRLVEGNAYGLEEVSDGYYLTRNGERVGEAYDRVDPSSVYQGERTVYTVSDEGQQKVVDTEGNVLAKEESADISSGPVIVDEKVGYVRRINTTSYYLVHGNNEAGPFRQIDRILEIDAELYAKIVRMEEGLRTYYLLTDRES
jgi:hypothetical protein